MGSEQSQHASSQQHSNSAHSTPRFNQRPVSADTGRIQQLQRGYTVATSDNLNNSQLVDSSPPPLDPSRPISPPMSVCSDSDLPYVSYTDKPIGDSPKNLRNKGQKINKGRPVVSLRRQSTSATAIRRPASTAGTMVVVNKGTSKEQGGGVERDSDLLRLQVSNFYYLTN